MSGNDLPLLTQVAEFASSIRYESVPEEVRKQAKLNVLDTIGCCVSACEGSTRTFPLSAPPTPAQVTSAQTAIAWVVLSIRATLNGLDAGFYRSQMQIKYDLTTSELASGQKGYLTGTGFLLRCDIDLRRGFRHAAS